MIPLSLYIHIPWCIQKCPYCDFNAHKKTTALPETQYYHALLQDLQQDLSHYTSIRREIHSIFFGGGTPSLLSGAFYYNLLQAIEKCIPFKQNIEITLEANPGTLESNRFTEYRQAGINRLSIGVQSFNTQHLQTLGRIHNDKQAHHAISTAYGSGFNNINLDIMYGLPNQIVIESLHDLQTAIDYQVQHISWYQLTLEPNTIFYKYKPILPTDDICAAIETQGLTLLKQHHYDRYEISAFCKFQQKSQHNLNYWLFGDYYGIGAGAHGKLTFLPNYQIIRTQKYRQPKDYLNMNNNYITSTKTLTTDTIIFEFMLNTSRLHQKINFDLFTQQTGLNHQLLLPELQQAHSLGLINLTTTDWQITDFGRCFTNNLQELFL